MSLIKGRHYFAGFAHVWTPVLASSQLGSNPVPVTVAGEKLVFFRAEGAAAALLDRCPHRGVALSLGRVREGCLECPFHGWRFAGDGEARFIPWNPDARGELLGAVSLPVAEAGGLIWLYTAPGVTPPPLPPIAKILSQRTTSVVKEQLANTHWSRMMENVLDAPHLPFVHRWTLGVAARAPADAGARMETSFTSTDYGGEVRWSVDGATSGPNQGFIRHYTPNVMQLGFQPDRGEIPTQLVAVVPVDATRTRSLAILAPGFSFFRLLDFLFGSRLNWEDRHVIETHEPPEVPRVGSEVSVRTDRGTLAFRKYYDATLRDSYAVMPKAERGNASVALEP
jgi:phenylpropionate dioxygenase-like ring-hydroxylating dioxygenase large terminal subunit